jgi:hypothetical protein
MLDGLDLIGTPLLGGLLFIQAKVGNGLLQVFAADGIVVQLAFVVVVDDDVVVVGLWIVVLDHKLA